MIRSPRLRSPLFIAAVALLLLTIAGTGYGLWYLFLQPSGPPPVDIAAVSLGPGSAAATAASSAGAPTDDGATRSPAGTAVAGGPTSISGTWKLDPSLGSFVGYRVQEQLASIGANTAVGRTSSVSGTMSIQGTSVAAVQITADLTALQSNDRRRDGQLSHQGIETSTYPRATFRLTSPIALSALPAEGQAVEATATGELTLHGQTRTVRIPLKAKLASNAIAVTGSLPIKFADYGIPTPRSFLVLSIADEGVMELQLVFTKG